MSVADSYEWQEKVTRWLRLKYGSQHVPVPDEHGGDFGIEGFSRDGKVYQCYAPREPLKAKELYQRQRRKLREDLDKFEKKTTDFQKLLGDLVISEYWFVTPEHKSAQLVQYSTTRATEIREHAIPYVSGDFIIHIATRDSFSEQIRKCEEANFGALRIEVPKALPESVEEWADSNDPLIGIVDGKASRLLSTTDEPLIRKYRTNLLARYIEGQNCLDLLRKDYTDIWEQVDAAVLHREKFVNNECMQCAEPVDAVSQQLELLRKAIEQAAPMFHTYTTETIVHGVAGEWWIKCDIDFRGEKHE